MPALVKAIEQRRFKQAKLLVQLGDDINDRNKQTGRTPLIASSLEEDANIAYKICEWLLGEGAEAEATDSEGMNAFMHACKQGRTKLAQLFLNDRDFDLNAQDLKGNTALFYSVKAGDVIVTAAIVNEMGRRRIRGCDKPNKNGETPLILAAKLGHTKCSGILLKDGNASPHARDMQMRLTASEWEQFMNSKTQVALEKSITQGKKELISTKFQVRKEAWEAEGLRENKQIRRTIENSSNRESDLSKETYSGKEMAFGAYKVATSERVTKAWLSENSSAKDQNSCRLNSGKAEPDITEKYRRSSTPRQPTYEMLSEDSFIKTEKGQQNIQAVAKAQALKENRQKSLSAKESSRSFSRPPQRAVKSASCVNKTLAHSCTELNHLAAKNAYCASSQSLQSENVYVHTNALQIPASVPDFRSKSSLELRYESPIPKQTRALSAPQRAYIRHVQRFRRENSDEPPESDSAFITEFRLREKSFIQNQLPKLLQVLGEQNMSTYRPKARPPEPKAKETKSGRKSLNESMKGGRRPSKVTLAWMALRKFSGLYAKTDFGSLAGQENSASGGLSVQNRFPGRRQSVAVFRGGRSSPADAVGQSKEARGQSVVRGRRRSTAVPTEGAVKRIDSNSSIESLRLKHRNSSGSESTNSAQTRNVGLTNRSASGVSESSFLSVDSDLSTLVECPAISVYP